MEFKVGDTVRFFSNSRLQRFNVNGSIGKVVVVNKGEPTILISVTNKYGKKYEFWAYRKELQLINQNKIVITTDGETVTAKKYEGKEVIKSATAKCHPDDEFDFDTGAKIAFDRLIEEPKENGKFKVGDNIKLTKGLTIYLTNIEWINQNAPEYSAYWQFDQLIHNDKDTFKIVAKAIHKEKDKGMLYLIQDESLRCYLVSEQGLELAED